MLFAMTFKKLLQDCIEITGQSEAQIAADLAAIGCTISQSTVHRIRSGEIINPKYSVGHAIVRLHRRIVRNQLRRINNV